MKFASAARSRSANRSRVCQSTCGYNTGCGCNSCAPQTTYAWEVAWWGLNNSPNDATCCLQRYGSDLRHEELRRSGIRPRRRRSAAYAYRPVNDYYDYQMPITAPTAQIDGYVRVLSQRVRTDFKAQNLELNFIRFPVCNTGCSTGSCGGYDACGCNGGCNAATAAATTAAASVSRCTARAACVTSMSTTTSCMAPSSDQGGATSHVRWFRLRQRQRVVPQHSTSRTASSARKLAGPATTAWASGTCSATARSASSTTTRAFGNGCQDGAGTLGHLHPGRLELTTFRSSKDSVAFLGELRVGTAYDISCHWRAVLAYRAVAITGLATASDQLQNDYTDRYTRRHHRLRQRRDHPRCPDRCRVPVLVEAVSC